MARAGAAVAPFVADMHRLWEFDAETGSPIGFTRGDPTSVGMTLPSTVWTDGEVMVLTNMFIGAAQMVDARSLVPLENHAVGFPYDALRLGADLAVVDLMAGGVVWASTRDPILAIDEQQVFLPVGLATDDERLWVGDWATGMLWPVDFDGRSVVSTAPIAFGLANPEGMALDIDGSLLVVETGLRRLSRVDPATGAISVVATDLDVGMPGPDGFPPTWWFDGVAVGPSGAIYVSENGCNVLTRIWPRPTTR